MDQNLPFSVSVDRMLCQTAATCLAYNIYELDDEAKAVLLTKNGLNSDDPANPLSKDGEVLLSDLVDGGAANLAELQDLVLESARACPFNAIIVKNTDGTILWPPVD